MEWLITYYATMRAGVILVGAFMKFQNVIKREWDSFIIESLNFQ